MKNEVSGGAGNVVQARAVGDVHFHGPRAEPPAPFQLPPAPRHFVSRRDELAMLGGWQAQAGPLLVVISGPGGVGKTALALRWLHDRRAEFPDGQLYVDLGAHSPSGPAAPEDVLEWFLHALGVSDVPVSLARRQALFRSATSANSFAMLLDNAASAAQVRPLLPASGTVVVTSRWRLSPLGLHGARFLDVEPMDVGDSVRLLEHVVGDRRLSEEPDAAQEIARLCGGLPIALSVVGARLSTRPRRSLSREVVELRHGPLPTLDSTVSVESVLDLSYVELPSRHARLYRLCAWHPGTQFGVDAAAAMADEPTYEVEDALVELVEKNLLTEVGDDRFQYHDVLRLHARNKPNADRDFAVRRVVEWYLDQAITADLAVVPGRERLGPGYRVQRQNPFDSPDSALEWLEYERFNLAQAVRTADEYDWPDLVWQLCEPLWGLFLYRHHYTDWIETHQLAIRAAAECGESLAEARLCNRLAAAYVNQHRYDDAIASLHAVLGGKVADPISRSGALSLLGRTHLERGDPDAALACFQEVLEIRLAKGRDRGVGGARRRIAQALIALGRPDEAIVELEQADALLTDPLERARTRTFLGQACLHAGQLDRAEVLLASARHDLRDSPFYLADVFIRLAELAEHRGDTERAHDNYRSALACYRDPADPHAVRIRALLKRNDDDAAPCVVPEQAASSDKRERR